MRHRRLHTRLAGGDAWDAFDGTGNVDDNVLDLPGGGHRAATLRSCDPATGLWSIWWLDGRWPHRLDVPMVGRFADDTLDGRPVRVRFLWRADESPRREQALSADGGITRETNWTMDFVREAPP